MTPILLMILAHYIGDYALQTNYMAMNKGKDVYVLLSHIATWTFVIVLTGMYLGIPANFLLIVFVLLIPHFIMDYIKSRNLVWCREISEKQSLLVDQVFHINQILLYVLLSTL